MNLSSTERGQACATSLAVMDHILSTLSTNRVVEQTMSAIATASANDTG